METTRLVVIGGFLGAGKTTLMGKAAQHLRSRGCKVGLITNDQAPDLVDTAWLARGGIRVEEVAGSCFCCNFPGLTGAIDRLRGGGAEIILAEPVGSCTDLSATILQPVKEMHPEVVLTPFTVLLDPARAAEVLGRQPRSLHPDAIYILTMQLTEADRIVLNKTDLLSDRQREDLLDGLRQRFPGSRVGSFSAERDQGVEGWLDGILENGAGAGQTILDIDYDKYANGEAVLGWVNVTAETVPDEVDGMKYMQSFFTGLRRRLHQRRFAVGHVKMMGHFHDGVYKGSLVDAAAQARIVYEEAAGAKPGAVTVNARVECEPGELQELIREVLAEAAGGRMRLTPGREHSLKPGRPNPTHRYKHVVQK